MDLTAFIRAFPALDLPLPETAVTANALRSKHGLSVFFTFHEDVELPGHSHGAQWGTVLAGQIALTRDGNEQIIRPARAT